MRLFIWGMVLAMSISSAGAGAPALEYLSDLRGRISLNTQTWGELGFDVAAHAPGQAPMKLQIGDIEYAKGLGHHASGEIVIELDGLYETFETEVGLQRQPGQAGSVQFQILVDGEKRFDSGVMRASDPARQVRIPVKGAQELQLVTKDGGDGIVCDCANWAEARLTRSADPTPIASRDLVDVALFARVVTSDPERTDGARAGRVEEYRAEDVHLVSDLTPDAEGVYEVPFANGGRGCIGLQWLERRYIRELALEFEQAPPVEGAQVQAWVGESAWQGNWRPLQGSIECADDGWRFAIDLQVNPDMRSGVRGVRWLFPAGVKPVHVTRLSALTRSLWGTARLMVEMENAPSGSAEVSIYNGEIVSPAGSGLGRKWDLSNAMRLEVRYSRPRAWSPDRTTLRFDLPGRDLAVAVDDVLASGCVYVRDAGLFVTHENSGISLSDYKANIADRKTVLERVREMPDQTLEQAMAKTANPIQKNGPMLLSLACDNRKFVVGREGIIEYDTTPDVAGRLLYHAMKYPGRVVPTFGSGSTDKLTRGLEGGWLPVPVIRVEDGGVTYSQRTFVAPCGDRLSDDTGWFYARPTCVAEYMITSTGQSDKAKLRLGFLADDEKNTPAQVTQTARGAAVKFGDHLLALVDTRAASPLDVRLDNSALVLSGTLAPGSEARVTVYIPAWDASEDLDLPPAGDLLSATHDYWRRALASAMQVEVPDPMLMNVIRAMQVHCLIAARSEEQGRRVAPWIAAVVYGPLESEAHSIVRGMDLMGHSEFARRSLDFFISRYNPAGCLTTGYTMMGTGWHLQRLGDHFALTQDKAWLNSVAPDVARACKWITQQREKTMQPAGAAAPERGLVPPGVMADWAAYAYYFCLNGYYCAGLESAGRALEDIGYPGSGAFTKIADEFRSDILRAYRWTQSRTPVYPLQDGTWTPGYPSQVHCPGPTNDYFPGEDGNRSWAYDVELGSHQLVPQGILPPDSPEVTRMIDHMEDVQFLAEGWFDYPAEKSRQDWFDLGGFAKVQPYYCRNAEIYAMRDDVRPFVRSYFNALASLLNPEVLWHWEHFHNSGAWDKTHETGYFLQQTRFMLVMEHADTLELAGLITSNWLKDGMTVAAKNAPTRFGPVTYCIESHTNDGHIEATIDPPTRTAPKRIVLRLRHPEGKPMRGVEVNGKACMDFDPRAETVTLRPQPGTIRIRAEY